jgi:hypothetical protein
MFLRCFQYASFDETGSRGVFIENAILYCTRHANAPGAHFSRREKSSVFISQFYQIETAKEGAR